MPVALCHGLVTRCTTSPTHGPGHEHRSSERATPRARFATVRPHCEVSVSPTRRRKTTAGVALGVAAVAAAAAAAVLVGPRVIGDEPTTGTSADGAASAEGVAATSSAPYTIKPEPAEVATDAPVEATGGRVDVVLTYAGFDETAGTVQAGGLVTGVLEDGGTCTLTLSNGAVEVTATSTGAADAASTTCGLLETTTGLAAGTWDAVLTYSS